MNLTMVLYITVNGPKKDIEKEKEYKYGKMEVSIKDIGKLIKQMGKEDLYMQMVMSMKENGSMTRLRVVAHMSIWMEPSMLEIGKKTDKMAMELKLGLIMLNMKAIMNSVKNMELEPLNGQTILHILENSIIIIFMEKEFIPGQIIENMRVNGEEIKCTVKEPSHGPMEEST